MRILILVLLVSFSTLAQNKNQSGRIIVAPDKHHLQYEDGTPFFWLGDTAWELFHRLNREEIKTYLDNRKSKGFNVIQAVILAEFNGLKTPNQEGQLPLHDLDPLKPNEKYFELVDYTIKLALERGMIIGLLPTWGDKVTKMWGEGPEIFNAAIAQSYGKFLGNRYKKYPNIIWILGGDRPPQNDKGNFIPIWRAMATGIESTYGKSSTITYHISGGPATTSKFLNTESWLDINMMQSGHGSGHDVPVWEWIQNDYKLTPIKPTLDSEPNYEDHPVNPWPKYDPVNGYFNEYDVRKQIYRSVFAGACGVTYGHHSIWQFWSPREDKVNNAIMYWTEAMDRPGAFQSGYLRQLMESRPFIKTIPSNDLVVNAGSKESYTNALLAKDGSFALVYIPIGSAIKIKSDQLSGTVLKFWWFNPRNGQTRLGGEVNKSTELSFISPTIGFGEDWVLIIDDSSKNFTAPGQR